MDTQGKIASRCVE